MRALQWILSILYIGFMVGSVLFFALGIILLFWAPYQWRFNVAKAWCQLQICTLKHVLGLDYEIVGRENIPEHACVVYWKHTSSWETFLTLAMWPKQCWVLKHELTFIPIFGWALKLIEPIAIDRKGGRSAVQQVVNQGREKIAEECWINIFPEGTRVPAHTTKRYGKSGAILAQETNTPILPIAHNAGDLWPRHSVLKRRGKILVKIGPPIYPAGKSVDEITSEAQGWIENAMHEISSAYRQHRKD
ncbi:MAG: lysophospholipid acyltransferase family protein [Gammaproteobacteria bacterium]|nr:lysophospholipid acyltransferase family protein [Gammaproteobacteria bacterium]